jgi:hypothetical protein
MPATQADLGGSFPPTGRQKRKMTCLISATRPIGHYWRIYGRPLAILAGLVGAIVVAPQCTASAAPPAKAAISAEASNALTQMGNTLRAEQFSFKARTIRAFLDPKGEMLHIFHTLDITVRRPNRLHVDVTGDDGPNMLIYDGKTLALFQPEKKTYATLPVPDTIQGMMQYAMGRLGVDFPLADFLTESPNKAFLTGVTAGREVNVVTIDGIPCRHLLFSQPPGIELELWVENNEQSLPRRLIVTYRSLPGQPVFIAEFSDWNFSIHPTDADFAFQPPEGAVRVTLKPPTARTPSREKAK